MGSETVARTVFEKKVSPGSISTCLQKFASSIERQMNTNADIFEIIFDESQIKRFLTDCEDSVGSNVEMLSEEPSGFQILGLRNHHSRRRRRQRITPTVF